jgi:class III poly(R)-hydroxyalkanoic acid synthase PhaE subunit
MDWAEQTNNFFKLWAQNQKSLWQTMTERAGTPGAATDPSSMQKSVRELGDMWKSSMESWMTLLQQGWPGLSGDKADASNLAKLFDLAQWAKSGIGNFDLALEHLTEGPTYATLWDLDRKLLNLGRLWQERTKDIAAHYAVVQGAWTRAFERFMTEVQDPAGEPVKSWRELLDLWIKSSNEALIEAHRSDEFLEAQRRMTRSATEYRLAEREIAEVFCELHHVPTRTEVDEVQRIVCELRREVRALRRELSQMQARPQPKSRTSGPAALTAKVEGESR